MLYENSTTEEYLIISTKTKVTEGKDIEQAIKANFEILQKEFPRLNIKQVGPVIMIYHLKRDLDGAPHQDLVLETGYPIGRGKMIKMDPQSKLNMRELKKLKCASFLFKGPVWETPWDEFSVSVKAGGATKVREIREIYRVFKGGGSAENEIELQIILA
jgi:hypothetical protein